MKYAPFEMGSKAFPGRQANTWNPRADISGSSRPGTMSKVHLARSESFINSGSRTYGGEYLYSSCVQHVQGSVLYQGYGWLEQPVSVHFVGTCAPNLRAMQEHGLKVREHEIRTILVQRMNRVLYAFESKGCKELILGPIGCGVFQVPVPWCVQAWREALSAHGEFFERIVWAFGEGASQEMVEAFEKGLESFYAQ